MIFEFDYSNIFYFIKLIIITLLSFSLGLNINRADFYAPIFHSLNKKNLYSYIFLFIIGLFIYRDVLKIYLAVSLLIISVIIHIWPMNRNDGIRKTTLVSYGNLFFLFLLIGLGFGLTIVSYQVYNKAFLIRIFLFVIQTIFLGNIVIWVLNRFLSKNFIFSFLYLFFFMLIIYKLNTELFFFSNVISVIWFGYIARNTVFSIAYRKDICNLLENKYLSFVLVFLGTFILDPQFMLQYSVITILMTLMVCMVFWLIKNKIYIGRFYYTLLLSTLVLSDYVVINDVFFPISQFLFLSSIIFIINDFFLQKHQKEKGLNEIYVCKKNDLKSTDIHVESILYNDYLRNPQKSKLQDFSFAGYRYGINSPDLLFDKFKVFNVELYGILPNTNVDLTNKIQGLLNEIGEKGGGILFFPAGIYDLNMNREEMCFLQINHSNIIIKGEFINLEKKTVFMSHQHTMIGDKNPWLSPFLITYGTAFQKTNLFWGLQFKNKKEGKTRSNSLTDPGSDGTIQSPKFATTIIENSFKGDVIIKVANTQNLKENTCILIGMYNTSDDGNLIKEILNRDEIPEEWKTALRAGPEKAPSFQWLVEIDTVLDSNTISLKQPLRRDILVEYEPEIHLVPMIENVGIENITFDCKWNGIFRHHGAPIYFSTKQSQIMDYGWNAINLCRVSHGFLRNVNILNFTNPMYVQDSRNITIENVNVSGHDGHQGIKLYGHSCDNLIKNINFSNHYADMIGGEGNCYGNVFTNINYINAENKPVDFDFHGFSEGPFSPPSYTLFECCNGFRGVKASGTLFNQPACALDNVWWNIHSEGFEGSSEIFKHDQYKFKGVIRTNLSASYRATIHCIQRSSFDFKTFLFAFRLKKMDLKKTGYARERHFTLFKNSIIVGYNNIYPLTIGGRNAEHLNEFVYIENLNKQKVKPFSLYESQLQKRMKEI